MLNADEILSLILVEPVAHISALRERLEVELEDLAGGMKIENLDEDDDADLIAEIQQLHTTIFYLSCAREALERGDAGGAVGHLRALSGNR